MLESREDEEARRNARIASKVAEKEWKAGERARKKAAKEEKAEHDKMMAEKRKVEERLAEVAARRAVRKPVKPKPALRIER